MISSDNYRLAVLFLSITYVCNLLMVPSGTKPNLWLQPAQAASDQAQTQTLASKTISQKALEKYQAISVTVEEEGKDVTYKGVPLRTLLAEMVPVIKLESMPEWKALSCRELVMEVTGDDGYPGLVTAIDLAINKQGDRFLLATHKDGKLIDSGVKLICKMDQARTRWVRQVVSLRLLALTKQP